MKSLLKLDRNSLVPLHKQVEDWLRQRIESGTYKPGEAIPSTKTLCEMLGGINHLTVRQAVSTLVRENLLQSIHGRGTYVKESLPHTPRIGLVLPNLDDEFTREIAHGVQEILDEQDLATNQPHAIEVLFDSRRSAQKEIDHIAQLQDLSLDGAIILPVGYKDLIEHLVRLKIDHFPFALVDWKSTDVEFLSVSSDNYKGGYLVTQHLLQQGRKNIAWIGNSIQSTSASHRLEGFRDAMNDAGLPYRREWIMELGKQSPTDSFGELLASCLKKILTDYPSVDGLVCSNDLQALECLKFFKKNGIKVPQKIAVTGFDNSVEAQNHSPSLTSVSQPAREMGRVAARLLLEKMQNPLKPNQQVILPVNLHVRETSSK